MALNRKFLIVPAPQFATMKLNGQVLKTVRIIPAILGVKGDFGKIVVKKSRIL